MVVSLLFGLLLLVNADIAYAQELALPTPHDGMVEGSVAGKAHVSTLTLPSAKGGVTDAEGRYSYSLAQKCYTLVNRNTGEHRARKCQHRSAFADRMVKAEEPAWDGRFRVVRYHGWGDYEYEYSVRDDAGNTASAAFFIRLGTFEGELPELVNPPPVPIETVFYLLPVLSLADRHVHRVSVVNFDDKNIKYEWEFISKADEEHTASETALGVLAPGLTEWNVNELVKLEEGSRVAAVLCVEGSLSRLLVSDHLVSKGDGSMSYTLHEHRHNDSRGCEAIEGFDIYGGE